MRAKDGTPTKFPYRVQVHLIAARYGMPLDTVREMPADDFMDALHFLSVTVR